MCCPALSARMLLAPNFLTYDNKSGVCSSRDHRSDQLSIAKDNLEADLLGLMCNQVNGIDFPSDLASGTSMLFCL